MFTSKILIVYQPFFIRYNSTYFKISFAKFRDLCADLCMTYNMFAINCDQCLHAYHMRSITRKHQLHSILKFTINRAFEGNLDEKAFKSNLKEQLRRENKLNESNEQMLYIFY